MEECSSIKKFIAYYRVSTERQGRSGLGLDAQKSAVTEYLAHIPHHLFGEMIEIESGRSTDRPQLRDALRLCRVHHATLIIAKLDRLARSVAFVSEVIESGIEFVAVDFPQANRLTIHILAAVAEHEGRCISERTKLALAAARKRGVVLGGDRGSLQLVAKSGAIKSAQVRREAAVRRAADIAPIIELLRREGRSFQQVAHELTLRNVPSARGGKWTASQVWRVARMAGGRL